jgi:hypothetical protein
VLHGKERMHERRQNKQGTRNEIFFGAFNRTNLPMGGSVRNHTGSSKVRSSISANSFERQPHCGDGSLLPSKKVVKTRQERVVAMEIHLFISFSEPFDLEQRLTPLQCQS